eukprot:804254-Amphidinium_carterae.1
MGWDGWTSRKTQFKAPNKPARSKRKHAHFGPRHSAHARTHILCDNFIVRRAEALAIRTPPTTQPYEQTTRKCTFKTV